ncbi:hypothetical protein HDU93_006082 [Gonapodya sp. JEL0774]|nr:hypothetical protein HDU93_006082 [Gonapodya sp. JEL0774]
MLQRTNPNDIPGHFVSEIHALKSDLLKIYHEISTGIVEPFKGVQAEELEAIELLLPILHRCFLIVPRDKNAKLYRAIFPLRVFNPENIKQSTLSLSFWQLMENHLATFDSATDLFGKSIASRLNKIQFNQQLLKWFQTNYRWQWLDLFLQQERTTENDLRNWLGKSGTPSNDLVLKTKPLLMGCEILQSKLFEGFNIPDRYVAPFTYTEGAFLYITKEFISFAAENMEHAAGHKFHYRFESTEDLSQTWDEIRDLENWAGEVVKKLHRENKNFQILSRGDAIILSKFLTPPTTPASAMEVHTQFDILLQTEKWASQIPDIEACMNADYVRDKFKEIAKMMRRRKEDRNVDALLAHGYQQIFREFFKI